MCRRDRNVPAELEKIPYNSRFIDVQAATQVRECYNPKHPATRRVGADYIRRQQDYLSSLGLINGVECGHEIYAAHYHYAEGLLSPSKFRIPDSGRKMTHVHTRSNMPAATEKFMRVRNTIKSTASAYAESAWRSLQDTGLRPFG